VKQPGLSRVFITAAILWLSGWLWVGRHAMLDDALIHLRYASEVTRAGFPTFDGQDLSYGSSSPLYTFVLACLLPIARNPLLPKVTSVAAYLWLFGLSAGSALRKTPRIGWAALSVLLLSPMAQRWLTDGMETSLVCVLVLCLAGALTGSETTSTGNRFGSVLFFLFGLCLVLIRVELSLAIFFSVLGGVCVLSVRHAVRRLLPLALGGLAGLGLLLAVFGQLLPDTAIAKRTAPISLVEAVFQTGRSTAAALSFGIGLLGLWALTLAWGLKRGSQAERLALTATNLLLPSVVFLIAAHGQIIHGVRHLLWVYLFLIAWNLGILGRSQSRETGSGWPNPSAVRVGWASGLVLLALAWSYETRAVATILESRSEVFRSMRSGGLERLRGELGAAYDVGFIGFFTGADLLDGNGLVNGRAVAEMSSAERIGRIGAAQPDFLFLTTQQAEGLAPFLKLSGYTTCHRYRTQNLRSEQIHILALSHQATKRHASFCSETLPTPAAEAS
jgi:hypothetical protein